VRAIARGNSGYQGLAQTGVAAALCVVLYVLGAGLPGVGRYLKYLCPSIMGMITQSYGLRQGALLAAVAALLIGMLAGLREFFMFALLLAPVGLVLPFFRQRGWRWQYLWYWLGYTVCFSLLVLILARLMGLSLTGFVRQMALLHYGLYGGFYQRFSISPESFADAVQKAIWLLLPCLSLAYGTMLTLINRFVLRKGSALLARK